MVVAETKLNLRDGLRAETAKSKTKLSHYRPEQALGDPVG
jgi:hypothetical protein